MFVRNKIHIQMTPKAQSILSYLGLFWLVAFFGGKNERNELSRYHLKQGLGLLLVGCVFNLAVGIVLVIIPSLATILGSISIVFLILMVLGIITAANEVKKPLPVIGRLFEDKFGFVDN